MSKRTLEEPAESDAQYSKRARINESADSMLHLQTESPIPLAADWEKSLEMSTFTPKPLKDACAFGKGELSTVDNLLADETPKSPSISPTNRAPVEDFLEEQPSKTACAATDDAASSSTMSLDTLAVLEANAATDSVYAQLSSSSTPAEYTKDVKIIVQEIPDSPIYTAKRPREEESPNPQPSKKAHVSDNAEPSSPNGLSSREDSVITDATHNSKPTPYGPPKKSEANTIFPPMPWPTTPQEDTAKFIQIMRDANDNLQVVLKYRSISYFTLHLIVTHSELRSTQFLSSAAAAREYEMVEFPNFAYEAGKKIGDYIRKIKGRCKWNGRGKGRAIQPWCITTESPTARFYYRLFGTTEGLDIRKMDLAELEKITGKLSNPDRVNDSLLACKDIKFRWNAKKCAFTVKGNFCGI